MDFERARFNMVEQQIRPWEVLDPAVLAVLHEVPREDFVPVAYRKLAFSDLMIPLAHGQTMMRPVIEGRMLQALELEPDETVLEVGTGSGYITACLARLASLVESVEIFEDLSGEARDRLQDQDMDNARLAVADALGDWEPEHAHDVVVVTGALPRVPEKFLGWVHPGGRMFVITGRSPNMEARLLRRRTATEWHEESLFETDLPYLINVETPDVFVF